MLGSLASTLGLTYPFLLGALPLVVGGLLYAYRKRGRGNRVAVSSILLLKSLERRSAAPKRFVPPIRFWIELLVLTLLILGAAGLYRKDVAVSYAVVIDNSFSMRAMLPGEVSGKTSFSRAKEEAYSFLASLGSAARITVVGSVPDFKAGNTLLLDSEAARSAVDGITLTWGEDNLSAVLGKLNSSGIYDRVVVFSDKRIKLSGASELADSVLVTTVTNPEQSAQNVALSHLSIGVMEGSSGGDKKRYLTADISSYVSRNVPITVHLEGISSEVNGSASTPLDTRSLTLATHESSKVEFKDLSDRFSVFHVWIEVDKKNLGSKGIVDPTVDAIVEDNEGWISASATREGLILVSELSPQELGLDKIRTLSFEWIKGVGGGEYEAALTKGRPFLFHRVTPDILPKVSSVFINPQQDNPLFPVTGSERSTSQAPITQWLNSHPTVSYLNLPDLSLKEHTLFNPPDWMQTLIRTTDGAVALVGTRRDEGSDGQESRYLVLGFDLFPYSGKDSPTLSVLTLNILKWISDLSSEVGYTGVRASVKVPPSTANISYSNGEVVYSAAQGGRDRVWFEHPGIVYLKGENASSALAVNFFSESESNLQQSVITDIALESSRVVHHDHKANFTLWMAAIGLLFLLLDLFFAMTKERA